MKVHSLPLVLYSLLAAVLQFNSVEASSPSLIIRSIAYNVIYRRYNSILSNIFGKELMKLLPAPSKSPVEAVPGEEISSMSLVSILENNYDLSLGDVLVDSEGEIFFFMSPTKKDPVISTLMRASSGLYEQNHAINNYTLIMKFESETVKYLDYSEVEEVQDRFKIIQEYATYSLLGSTTHSIVFVAPRSDLDSFIRNDLQQRLSSRKKKKSVQLKDYSEAMAIGNDGNSNELVQLSRGKSDSIDNIASPDTVAIIDVYERVSHVEMLFKDTIGDAKLRFEFIYHRLVPSLIRSNFSLKDLLVILKTAERVFRAESIVEYIKVTGNEEITVVGDIHGQFVDLLRIFRNCGWPSESKKYLFNGDIVDRGEASIQCLILLYALKITFPKSVYINRGNHESEMCGKEKFFRDSMKIDPNGVFYEMAQLGFEALPIASVINDRIYVVHAGIRGDYDISKISKMDRYNLNDISGAFVYASLWDDASEREGIHPNRGRGGNSCYFGPDATVAFLELNAFDRIIRSHSYTPSGIEVNHGGNCWTLFSAPNYGGQGNVAAVVTFSSNLEPTFSYFGAKKPGAPIEY